MLSAFYAFSDASFLDVVLNAYSTKLGFFFEQSTFGLFCILVLTAAPLRFSISMGVGSIDTTTKLRGWFSSTKQIFTRPLRQGSHLLLNRGIIMQTTSDGKSYRHLYLQQHTGSLPHRYPRPVNCEVCYGHDPRMWSNKNSRYESGRIVVVGTKVWDCSESSWLVDRKPCNQE